MTSKRPSGVPGELMRLAENQRREKNWQRFGPYLSERQWGTVREDYSADGDPWQYLPHDHARSRAYRWGEDGILGISDRQGRLCFAIAIWNGNDAILKERLFGLTGHEGNHGEDVKELYYYLDATPTSSYLKGLYKYPQAAFPYERLLRESRRRGLLDPEFELLDAGAFDQNRYFDVLVEYAKASPEDIVISISVTNRGPEREKLIVLPTLWFRNTWAWGRSGEGYGQRPEIRKDGDTRLRSVHEALGEHVLHFDREVASPTLIFTENETNYERLFSVPSRTAHKKDGFNDYVVLGQGAAINPECRGTKAAALYELDLAPSGTVTLKARLVSSVESMEEPFGMGFDEAFALRKREADAFYERITPAEASADEKSVFRQAHAGLLWSKQFYHYAVKEWLDGDPFGPSPPESRARGRNSEWQHTYCRDVISMPDTWEYPWFAAWDLAFQVIPLARTDPDFAKSQLILLLREWYMHPNGQLPAYEFAFSDVNPPLHAWAAWRVYKMSGRRGERDVPFLKRTFQKLLLNFTWWVNRKDEQGNNLFSGGFLGLDNVGIFDRSKPLPTGGYLAQADGTAWMAFFAGTMLSIALELAKFDDTYEDLASKFFEHFVSIVDAMNDFGGTGLWDETDGFYYDQLNCDGVSTPLRTRSMVGIIPLFIVEVLDDELLEHLPGFKKRMDWFIKHRADLSHNISYMEARAGGGTRRLLAVPSRERLLSVLRYVLDENEFLSPYGVRSLSRVHKDHPFVLSTAGSEYRVGYAPGESESGLFGGNSNWRGPVWLPVNYLLVEALERYHYFYGDTLLVECPTGSGKFLNLSDVAGEIATRVSRLFLPRPDGSRPCHGDEQRYARDPNFRSLLLFYEYFHGDDGRGLGASHQTGWTALIATFLEGVSQRRAAERAATPKTRSR